MDKRFKLLFPHAEIQKRIDSIAAQMTKDLEGKNPLFIAVLNGAFMFAADLMKAVQFPCEITFVKMSSYRGMESCGKVQNLIGLDRDIEDRHIVIIEDIVDSGLSMKTLINYLQDFKPASLRIACCTYKPAALKCPLSLDYVGFEVENLFLVGYGLDYDGYGRNFEDIYVLAEQPGQEN